MLSKLLHMRKRFITFAEGVTLTEQICYKCWASCSSWERDSLLLCKSYCYRTDLLKMLSNLLHMRKRFITFAEGVTLTEQICYKCWASCSSWERDSLLLCNSYCYRTDLLQMLSNLFLMRKRFITFAEGVTLTEQICYKCWASCFSWATHYQLCKSNNSFRKSNWSVAHE